MMLLNKNSRGEANFQNIQIDQKVKLVIKSTNNILN